MRVTDVASQARWIFPLLNARGPGAALSLATWPGRVLYVQDGSRYPVAVRADGTVYWAGGRVGGRL